MAISDEILKSLDSNQLSTIAAQFGLQPEQVKAVIADAAPALLGGMSRNAQTGEGAASLANALGDHTQAQPLSDLGSLLSGGAGGSILEKVLGGATPQVSEAIGAQAGVNSSSVQGILKTIAPMVMAFLAQRVASGGKADPAVVKEKVEAERQAAEQQASSPNLGSILGQILGNR